MCRSRAAGEPDRKSFSFLGNGQDESESLTLAELDLRARAIAAEIGGTVAPGARAVLNYDPGLDFITAFFGCLYAGVIAVPVATIDSGRNEHKRNRLRSILESARPELLLTTDKLAGQIDIEALETAGRPLTGLATDRTPDALAARWSMPEIEPDTVAYLQYSSGSTGVPKGVVLTHQNVLSNLALIHQNGADASLDGPPPPVALWLPLFHDMGLVNAVLQPLYVGYDATLMSPLSFVQRPFNWLNAISRLGGAISVAPNFAYDLCVLRVSAEQREQLDLSGWTLAAVGAEPVRAETLDRFCATFEPCGFERSAFFPCYGLAESTVMVSGGPPEQEPVVRDFDADALVRGRVRAAVHGSRSRTLVGCGQIQPSMTVTVVDPVSGEVTQDSVGEIHVASASVGAGYWAAPELTTETFSVAVPGHPDRLFLRTGDLGFVHDDQLFITGRAKDVIILDGLNHYPHDLELTASLSHPLLRVGFCCAFSTDDGERERLVLLAEVTRRFQTAVEEEPESGDGSGSSTVQEVQRAVRGAVAQEHGVRADEVILLRMGALPFTSSGKVQRLTSRDRYAADGFADKRIG